VCGYQFFTCLLVLFRFPSLRQDVLPLTPKQMEREVTDTHQKALQVNLVAMGNKLFIG